MDEGKNDSFGEKICSSEGLIFFCIEDEEKSDFEAEIKEEIMSSVSLTRAWGMAAPHAVYLLLGSVGAVFAGGAFPAWGIMFAKT